MRILLFSATFAPRRGGVETVTRHLAAGLSGRGHPVVVATNRYPRSLPRYEEIDGIPVHRQLYPAVMRGRGERRTLRQRLVRIALLPLAPVAFVRLYRLTRRVRPDLVNIHYFSSPALYMLAVARLLRIPVVLSFHGSDVPTTPYAAIAERSLRWVRAAVETATACSDYLAGCLRPLLGLPVFVAHNGIDDSDPISPAKGVPRGDYLLVVARLVPKKGVEVAVRAMALLLQEGYGPRLLIAGDGPERETIEQLVHELGLEGTITLLGATSPEMTRDLMAGARMVVAPSHWEAFGMVCLEAMVAGRAVVGTRTGGIPEIVVEGETGLLVPPNDPRALADAIAALLKSPQTADEMGRKGRARALGVFSWDRTIESYLDAYTAARREALSDDASPAVEALP